MKKAAKRPKDASETLVELRKTPEYQRATPMDRSSAPGTRERLLPDSDAVTLEARTKGSHPFRRRLFAGAMLLCLLGLIVLGAWSRHRRDAPRTALPDEDIETKRGDSKPMELMMADGSLYFTADDGVHGRELWTAIPSKPRRVVEDGKAQSFTNPHSLFAASNRLYFAAETSGTGSELFSCAKISGWPPVVKLVRDILPGAMGSDPRCFADHWPTTLFYAKTSREGREIWSTNGTDQQTGIVRDLNPGPADSLIESPGFVVGNDFVYFTAILEDLTMCRYSFSDNTIKVLFKVSEDACPMGIIGDNLLFAQSDTEHGRELWTSNAITGETRLLKDIAPGPASSKISDGRQFGDRLLFQATTQEAGEEPWISDGTEEGTHMLRDVRPGPEGSVPTAFTVGGAFASFRANDGTHGQELWATDGTSEGTMLVKDVRPGKEGSNPYNNIPRKSYIAFSANDGEHGEELWLAKFKDGHWTAELTMDIAPGPADSEPFNLVWWNDARAFFSATAPDIGRELFELCAEPINPQDVITRFDLRPKPAQSVKPSEHPR